MAAVLLGGDGAAASHGAAGTVWRLRRSAGGVIDVTAPRRRRTRSPVRFHHEALPPDEVTVERRIPVTTVPRTLLDLALVLDAHGLERAINEAEVRRLRDRLSLLDLLERHPRRAGTATLRSLLAAGLVGAGVTRSELEDRFLAFLDAAELERPGLNVPLRVGRGWVEVDCLWRAQRLIVELDGRAAHATAQAFERDRARDRARQAAGWRVVRITWRQLHERPEELALELSALLAWQPLARHPPTAARHP